MQIEFNCEEMRDRQMYAAIEFRLRKSFIETWPDSTGSPRLFRALAASILELFKEYNGHLQKQVSYLEKTVLRQSEISVNPPMLLMKSDDLADAGIESMAVLLNARDFQKEMRHIFGPFYIRRKAKK